MLLVSVADEEALFAGATDQDESQRQYDIGELISFASFDFPNELGLQGQKAEVSPFDYRLPTPSLF